MIQLRDASGPNIENSLKREDLFNCIFLLQEAIIAQDKCWGHCCEGSELMVDKNKLFDVLYNTVERAMVNTRDAIKEYIT